MRKFTSFALIALVIAAVPPLYAQDEEEESSGPWQQVAKPESTDETSRRLIELHLKARGGRDALEKIRSLRCEGELIEGQKDYALTIIHSAPDRIRYVTDRFFKGYNYIEHMGSDGSNAWAQETDPQRKNPRPLSGLDRQLLELDAALPFLFLDPDANGVLFAYQREETFAKRKAYTVHGWLKNGQRLEILFDAESFLVINYRQVFKIGGETLLVDRVPTGMTRVNDTWWEKGYKFQIRGKTFREINYFKIEGTENVNPDAFKEPPTRERWLRGAS